MVDGRTFQRESITTLWTELAPLAEQHYAETQGATTRIDLQRDMYAAIERDGSHRFDTVRINDDLIGYSSMFLHIDRHDGVLGAHEDAIYVLPRFRGWLGIDFEHWVDTMLAADGVHTIYRERPLSASADKPDRALRRGPRGYKPYSVLWRRDLQAAFHG